MKLASLGWDESRVGLECLAREFGHFRQWRGCGIICVHVKVGVIMTWVESQSRMGCGEMGLEWGTAGQFRQDRMAFLPCFINCTRFCQILVSQALRVLLYQLVSVSGKKK